MGKLLKYDIRENSRFFLGVILFVCGFSTYFQISFYRTMTSGTISPTPVGGMMVVMAILGLFGAGVTSFLKIVGGFHKELKEDRGYLTFTLPLSGRQILGVKLLTAFLWYIIMGSSIILYNLALGLILHGSNLIELIRLVGNLLSSSWVGIFISSIVEIFQVLLIVYFAMTICNISFRNKKYTGVWFIVFLLLSGISSFVQGKVSQWIPYYFNFSNMSIEHISKLRLFDLSGSMYMNPFQYSMSQMGGLEFSMLGIGSFLYSIVIIILLFFSISYMLENKVDI